MSEWDYRNEKVLFWMDLNEDVKKKGVNVHVFAEVLERICGLLLYSVPSTLKKFSSKKIILLMNESMSGNIKSNESVLSEVLVVNTAPSSSKTSNSKDQSENENRSSEKFTCRNCGGGDRGRVAIYRPFGEVSLSLNRTVTCMVLKANDRRTSCPCHDEFRGPHSDYVRQVEMDRWGQSDPPCYTTARDERRIVRMAVMDCAATSQTIAQVCVANRSCFL
ncbi:uncharacterized protein TNCV_1536151 [Trichonephila clavipes]|nr:uncharacterized protein TNCV_1536151 [Trichonephila clavipes]